MTTSLPLLSIALFSNMELANVERISVLPSNETLAIALLLTSTKRKAAPNCLVAPTALNVMLYCIDFIAFVDFSFVYSVETFNTISLKS